MLWPSRGLRASERVLLASPKSHPDGFQLFDFVTQHLPPPSSPQQTKISNMAASDANIILYTNHGCPWAHRVHIALSELHVPVDEVIIDLDVPRTAEYLAINPAGLVPAISYNDTVISESAIVAQFLADKFPSHLAPESGTVEGALQRARVSFFVDAFFSKFQFPLFRTLSAKSADEEKSIMDDAVAALAKDVEPLLQNAGPFFGGSTDLTMAEVLTGSFVLRLITLPSPDVYPAGLHGAIQASAPAFWKWAEHVSKHPSITNIYDVNIVTEGMKKRFPKQFTA
ncbi:thioredoxin-like protein [Trichoderma ceciliae]